jgi:PiT family inorganic phosphate transporter
MVALLNLIARAGLGRLGGIVRRPALQGAASPAEVTGVPAAPAGTVPQAEERFPGTSPRRINDRFRRLQILSASYMALSHGSNDAQKTMGIMTLALFNAGAISDKTVPIWVILIAATAMSLGTAAGGWRIMKTMGQRVVKLDPVHGFAAETTAATIILGAAHFGMPVSTTHVISSAIMGVGTSDRIKAVRWGVARSIVTAWVLTIPCAAAIAAAVYLVLHLL